VRGQTILDTKERAELSYRVVLGEPSPVGCIDGSSGRLVKGPLTDGRLYLWRGLPDYAVEQVAVDSAGLGLGTLRPSRFAEG
jgi:hypothetical protein